MVKNLAHISNIVARKVQRGADSWAAAYWHGTPFCAAPRATKDTYLQLWCKAKSEVYPEIDAIEKSTGYALNADWMHDLALHTQIVIKTSPLCYQHGRVLYSLLRQYLSKCRDSSVTIMETGTARGFSATVMALAMRDAGNHGRIITFDLLPHDTKMYWNCIDDLEGQKTRRELLSPWCDIVDNSIMFVEGDSRISMDKFKMGRIHFAFLDGAHTYEDVMAELNMVVPHQKAGDIIVFDDYSSSIFPGLVKAVDEGCALHGYSMNVIRSNGDRAYVVAIKR